MELINQAASPSEGKKKKHARPYTVVGSSIHRDAPIFFDARYDRGEPFVF